MISPQAHDEGFRLKQFIKSKGISQVQLAEIFDVQKGTVSKYINGALRLSNDQIRLLNNKYDLSFDWLYNGEHPMTVHKKEDKNLMLNLSDLKQLVQQLQSRVKKQEIELHKLVTDFYAAKHSV